MKQPGLSLKYKLALFVITLILILFILTYYIIINHEKNILHDGLIQKGKNLINNFSLYCENAFLTGDELSIEDYITVFTKDPEVTNVYIVSKDSSYLFHSRIGYLGKKYKASEKIEEYPDKTYNQIKEQDEILYQFYKPVYKTTGFMKKEFFGMGYLELNTKVIGIKLNTIRGTLISIFVLLLIAGIIGASILSRYMTNPIKQLINGINIIARGDLQYKIEITTRDEIEDLAVEFNRMTTQLATYQKKLIRQKIVEQELQIARNIQSRIIPEKLPKIEKYEVFNFYQSARIIGGDYHNMIPVNSSEYLFVIADVSGKGIPASLLMVMFHTVLITLKQLHSNPVLLIKAINNIMSVFLKQGDFITSLFALFNVHSNKMKVISAGHEPPLLINITDKRQPSNWAFKS